MTYNPTALQTGSTALRPDSAHRTAGLGLTVTVPPAGWPALGLEAGQGPRTGRTRANEFQVVGPMGAPLGEVQIVGSSPGTAGAITGDWAHVVLPYTSPTLTVSASRLSPAVALDTAATGVRLGAGNVSGWTMPVGDNALVTRASAIATPKYVAYHTSGAWVVRALTGSDFTFPALDSNHLLLWWGNASYWVETFTPPNVPWDDWPDNYFGNVPVLECFQADWPLLCAFQTMPTAIRQDTTNGGVLLTFTSNAANLWTVQPLYGRTPQQAATWETAGAGTTLPTGAAAQLDLWAGYTAHWPQTVAETTSYNSGTDTLTYTEAVTVRDLGSWGATLAPLPPWLSLVRGLLGADCTVAGTVTDLATPTAWGPLEGLAGLTPVSGVLTYTWALHGTNAYLPATRAPGGGSVPGWLQALLDSEATKLAALTHPDPWLFPDKFPGNGAQWVGHLYWADAGDPLYYGAEALPLLSSVPQTALRTYLAAEYAASPPETTAARWPTGSALREQWGEPQQTTLANNALYTAYLAGQRPDLHPSAVPLWNCLGLARYCQVQSVTPDGTMLGHAQDILQDRLAERDWASGAPYSGHGQRLTAVEDANRDLAGLGGAIVLHQLGGDTTTANLVRGAWGRLAVLRLGMVHYPRWLASTGAYVLPASATWAVDTDAGQFVRAGLNVWSWTTSADDARQVFWCDQFGVRLACHSGVPSTDQSDTRWHTWYGQGRQLAYWNLTQEVAAWLRAYAATETLIYGDKVMADDPLWWATAQYGTFGAEHAMAAPGDSHGLLLARAWVAGDTADTLAGYLSVPWLTAGGDLYTLQKAAEVARVYAGAATTLTIGTVTATPSGSVAAGTKLELRFAITNSVATYVDLPYDPSPPAHIDGTLGITVQAEVSDDNWASYLVQPAYYHQDVMHAVHGGDWFYPTGTGGWQVRWTPPHAGTWHYRLRATDAGGTTVTTPMSLTVTAATTHGLLRVSAADSRYFEYQDGTYAPLNAGGINLSSGSGSADVLSTDDPVSATLGGAPTLTHLANQGIRWGRFWTNDWGAWGNDNNGWHQPFDPNANWYTSAVRAPGHVTSVKIQPGSYSQYLQRGFITNSQRGVSVKESTTYRAQFRFALGETLVAVAAGAESYGLVLKWSTGFGDPTIHNADDTNLTPYSLGALGTFVTVTGTFTTGAGVWTLPYLWLVAENCQSGVSATPWVYVDSIQIQEDLGGGAFGPNLVDSDDMDRHRHVQPLAAARLDAALAQAEAAGFAFLWTVLDKADYLLMLLNQTTGDVAAFGDGQYPAAGTAVRWYHAAWWRYTQARWGYSPAILAWELCNEQDLAGHPEAENWAEAFADAMAGWANVHPATTSRFQADVPGDFWLEPRWGVAHIHAYVTDNTTLGATVTPYLGAAAGFNTTNGHAEFRDTAQAHLTLDAGIGAGGTYPLGKPVIRGEIGFISAGHTPDEPTTEFGADTADKWLSKFVCASAFSPGGVLECYWHAKELITGQLGPRDATGRYQAVAALLATLPLNNGHYVDAAAIAGDANLRVIGQQDATHHRGHLWIDNRTDTWYTTVNGPPPTPVPAGTTITVPNVPVGNYVLTWIRTADGTVIRTEPGVVS